MLGQSEVVKLLEKCNGDPTAIEEILSAYVVWKLLKGRSTAYVLVKLKDLCNLLKLTGQYETLQSGREAFLIVATECKLGGDSRIGALPTVSPIAKDVWNRIRRHPNYKRCPTTDTRYGGPGPVQAFLNADQVGLVERDRNRWAERYFMRRPQFGNEGVPEYSESTDVLPRYVANPSRSSENIER